VHHRGEYIVSDGQQRGSQEAVELTRRRARIAVSRVLSLAAVLWLAFPVPGAVAQRSRAAAPPVLRDLAGTAELRSIFERENDKIRIVLLLSPT
jgi:hypothetical protein